MLITVAEVAAGQLLFKNHTRKFETLYKKFRKMQFWRFERFENNTKAMREKKICVVTILQFIN